MPAKQPAAVEDDDFVSADGDDPEEQDELYNFLDAVSVASLELRRMRCFELYIAFCNVRRKLRTSAFTWRAC